MNPTLITMAFNILLAVFVVIGFLWGLGRGLKKSLLRFGFFIGFVIIFALISPIIAKALLGINVGSGTIEEMIKETLLEIEFINDIVASNPGFMDFITQLPLILVNLVLFIVLALVAKMLSWVGYSITAKIIFKKHKTPKTKEVYAVNNGYREGIVSKIVTLGPPPRPGLPPAPQKKRLLAAAYLTEVAGNGVWLINGKQTDIKFNDKNKKLPNIEIDNNNFFVLNGQTTSVKAEFDAFTQNNEGFWLINNQITAIKSKPLEDKKPILTLSAEKKWVIDGKKTEIIALNAKSNASAGAVNEKPTIIMQEVAKPKKHRLLGGLVGAVQGLVVMFLLFLPVSGIIKTATSYVDTSVYAASEASDFEYQELSKMITESVPKEVFEYVSAYENSIFNKITGVGGIDLVLFDSISTVRIDGQKITLRHELDSVLTVTESVLYVSNIASDPNISWTEVDFAKLNSAIDRLFDSGIITTVLNNTISVVLENALSGEEGSLLDGVESADMIKEVLQPIQDSLQASDQTVSEYLKTDIKAILSVLEAVCKSGLADYLMNEDIDQKTTSENIENILKILKPKNAQNEVVHDYLQDIVNGLFSSQSLQSTIVGVVNIAVQELDTYVRTELGLDENDTSVKFSKVSINNINWTNVKNEVNSFVSALFDIADYVATVEVLEIEGELGLEDVKALLSEDKFETAFDGITTILNILKDSSIMKGSEGGVNFSIYEEVLTQLNRLETFEAVNLESFKTTNFATDFDFVKEIISFAKTNVFPEITSTDFEVTAEFLNEVFENILAVGSDNKSELDKILENIFANKIVRELFIDLMNEEVIPSLEINEGEHGRIDKTADWQNWGIFTQEFSTIVSNAFNIFLNLEITDFDAFIEDLEAEPITKIINNNFNKKNNSQELGTAYLLGETIDIMINSQFFTTGTGTESKQILKSVLIKNLQAVADEMSLSVNFEQKINNASTNYFRNEFTKLAPAVEVLLNKEIEISGITYSLFEAITSEDVEVAIADVLELFTRTDVEVIANFICETDLLKETAIDLINILNEEIIENFDSDTAYTELPATTNLSTQKADFVNIIYSVIEILKVGIDDLENTLLADTADGETLRTNIKALITSLETNSSSSGVFTQTYDAVFNTFYDIINEANKTMIQVLDESYSTNLNRDFDLAEVFDSVIEVLQTAKELENIEITDLENDLLNNTNDIRTKIKNLLSVLKENQNGIFGDAYTALSDEFYDTINTANKEMVKALDDSYSADISKTNFDAVDDFDLIISVLEKAKEVKDVNITDLADDLLANANNLQTKIKELLTILQQNKQSIFGDAYTAIFNEFYNAINNANKTMVQAIDSDYNSNIVKANFDPVADFDVIISVLEKAKAIEGITITNLENDLLANANNLQTKIKELIGVLEANKTGIFGDAFNAINTEFYNTINTANKEIIKMVDSTYNTNLASFDLLEQFDSIMNVLGAAKDLKNASIAEIDELLNTTNSTKFKAMLLSLQTHKGTFMNNNESYAVFSDAFDKIYVEFYKAVNDANKEIIALVSNETVSNIPTTVNLINQFDDIVSVFNSAKEFESITINGLDDLVSSTNSVKMQELLTNLKTNATTSGVFTTAYNAVTAEIRSGINTAGNTVYELIEKTPTDIIGSSDDVATNFVENAKVLNAIIPLKGQTSMAGVLTSSRDELIVLLVAMQNNANAGLVFAGIYTEIYEYLKNYESGILGITDSAATIDWETVLSA